MDKVMPASALDKSLVVEIDAFGKKQLTYKGWPLYYFNQVGGMQGSTKGIACLRWPVPNKM